MADIGTLLADLNDELVLTFTTGGLFVADIEAPLIQSPFAADGTLAPLPPGYHNAGITDGGGVDVQRAITMTDQTGWQRNTKIRSDVQSDYLSPKAILKETNATVIALKEFHRFNEVVLGGPVALKHVTDGSNPERRALLLGYDSTRQILAARYFPRVKVMAVGNEVWNRAQSTTYDITFDSYYDKAYGTDSQYFIGSAGWTSRAVVPGAVAPAV